VGAGTARRRRPTTPHAFNFFREKGLLAIPFSDYSPYSTGTDFWGGFVSELRVFGVDVNTGFTPKGAISLADVYQGGPTNLVSVSGSRRSGAV